MHLTFGCSFRIEPEEFRVLLASGLLLLLLLSAVGLVHTVGVYARLQGFF